MCQEEPTYLHLTRKKTRGASLPALDEEEEETSLPRKPAYLHPPAYLHLTRKKRKNLSPCSSSCQVQEDKCAVAMLSDSPAVPAVWSGTAPRSPPYEALPALEEEEEEEDFVGAPASTSQ